jgi:type I restriction enzyme M protein
MVEIIEPRPGMSIYDPTCGSGGMLLEVVQYLKDRGEDARTLSLYGQEKNFATWGIAEINLFLHNVDDAFIAKGDTILSPKRYDPKAREFVQGIGAYDRVLANPPFSEKVWGYDVWQNGDPFGRDVYGCPPKGYGDLAFVQHMLASLKDDGMMAVVVPHGVLFRGGAEGRIREAMLDADVIEAVVGLATNLFYGAGIPAALLLCRKTKPAERRGKVLIVNGDATYQPGKAQNFLSDAHVHALASAVHGFADIEKLARVVPVQEIAANGHNLNISRFVQTGADAEAVDVAAEVAKLQDLIAERNEAEAAMFGHLKRLGYVN